MQDDMSDLDIAVGLLFPDGYVSIGTVYLNDEKAKSFLIYSSPIEGVSGDEIQDLAAVFTYHRYDGPYRRTLLIDNSLECYRFLKMFMSLPNQTQRNMATLLKMFPNMRYEIDYVTPVIHNVFEDFMKLSGEEQEAYLIMNSLK